MEKYQRYIVGSLGFILLGLFFIYFTNIVAWVLIAAFVAMLGTPIVDFITKLKIKKFHIPTWLASMFTICLMYFLVISALQLIFPLIANQVHEFQNIDLELLFDKLEKPMKSVEDFISTVPFISQPNFSVEDFLIQKISSIINFASITSLFNDLGGTLVSFLLSIFVITFISFFFLKDKHLFSNAIILAVPTKYEDRVNNVIVSIRNLISRYLFGIILEMVLMIILFTIGLYIIGFNFNLALLVGLIAGILNIIPYVGPWIGAIIGIALFVAANIQLDFSVELIPMIIKILAVFLICKITDDALFQPFIYSKSVKAHPLEIFLMILIAGSIYGILGMMLAIPAYTVIRVIAKEFLYEYKFIRKLTSNINISKSHKEDEKSE